MNFIRLEKNIVFCCMLDRTTKGHPEPKGRKNFFFLVFSVFLIKKREKAVVDTVFVVETFSRPCVVWSPGEESAQCLWSLVNSSPILCSELLV